MTVKYILSLFRLVVIMVGIIPFSPYPDKSGFEYTYHIRKFFQNRF